MRILHASRNTAAQPAYAVAALRRLGHEAEIWEYGANRYGFPADRVVDVDGLGPRAFWDTFLEAIDRFDVLHFHSGRSLFPSQRGGLPPFWDLPIYRILGKRVFFTFHGSDVRIRRIHEQVNPWSHYRTADVRSEDDQIEKTIEVIRTYADRMFVVSVDYKHFIPDAEFVPRIIDLDGWPIQDADQRDIPVVLHAPTTRGKKGTEMVLAGLERLRQEGVAFELRLIENVPHEEAKAAIRDADIVVDNLITGDYEMVSIEAMASSRVAVANVGPAVATALPDAPVVSVDPDTFVDRMRELIAGVDDRRAIATRGRPYVERTHDAMVVARQLVAAYEAAPDPVPIHAFPDWMTLAHARAIETLEARNARLEREVERARWREEVLRRRLGLAPLGLEPIPVRPSLGDRLKAALPGPVRMWARRTRARLRSRP